MLYQNIQLHHGFLLSRDFFFYKLGYEKVAKINARENSPQSLSICSHVVKESTTSSSPHEGLELQRQKIETKILKSDLKRKQLKHKEDGNSFWRSWFSFGSTYSDSDTDSDDENRKKDSNKLINKNSRPGKGRENVTMSTRKSSACAYHNFNNPHPSEEKRTKIRSSTDRTLR